MKYPGSRSYFSLPGPVSLLSSRGAGRTEPALTPEITPVFQFIAVFTNYLIQILHLYIKLYKNLQIDTPRRQGGNSTTEEKSHEALQISQHL